MVDRSSHLQCLLVKARDDPMEPGNAHVQAGAADLRSEAIRDRVLPMCAPSLTRRNVAPTTQCQ
jgi:hypothetical protein